MKITKRKKPAKRRPDERKFLVWSGRTPLIGPVVFVPGYVLPSRANERLHWRSAATLTARQRDLGRRMGQAMIGCGLTLPTTITLTRKGARLLDDDNLASAFKHVRDGIADACGVDDSKRGPITWVYTQETGKIPGIDARWTR